MLCGVVWVWCCARGKRERGGGRGAIDGETVIDLIVDRFSPTSRTLTSACRLCRVPNSRPRLAFSSGLPRGCGTAP